MTSTPLSSILRSGPPVASEAFSFFGDADSSAPTDVIVEVTWARCPRACTVAMSGVLGDRDRLDVVAAVRRLADIDKAKRRHPSNGR